MTAFLWMRPQAGVLAAVRRFEAFPTGIGGLNANLLAAFSSSAAGLRRRARCGSEDGPGEDEIPKELDRWIRQQGRDLRLRPDERQAAVKLVNNLRNDLVKFLKDNEEQPFFRSINQISLTSC
ncbi:uncharacterized protein LOC128518446 isoform X3 [Clarias gariepinus]|uniref:uncharacterized protein LOC128518446 isoform X3 n=1 Tax=Clarias gariepinus TaxID=13013 RepID=UPI00234D56F1|nr:uncharacterized protein LOC128518446 isoform X3 [Clarias gariepinus]